MPRILAVRSDILRKPEIDDMLQKNAEVYKGSRLQCIIAIAWLFGKRINEILSLQRQDVWVEGSYLYVRFHVSKKPKRNSNPVPKPFLKRLRREHPYVPYVLNWLSKLPEDKGFLFPSYSGERIVTVKGKDSKGNVRVYQYRRLGGFISDARIKQRLKQVNPNCWMHLL